MYTPQVVVGGVVDGVGNSTSEVLGLIARGKKERKGRKNVGVFFDRKEVVVQGYGGEVKGCDVLEVVYDPAVYETYVERGENRERRLKHWNLVQSVKKIGEWRGEEVRFGLGEGEIGLERVVLVQEGVGGRILGGWRV